MILFGIIVNYKLQQGDAIMENEKVFRGIMKLEPHKILPNGNYYGKYFTDIIHFFNADMEEVELISFPDTKYQQVTTFNPPRQWSKQVLNDYQIDRIRY